MTIHGAPRATMDIDLLVLSESLNEVWQIAQNLGYWVEGLPLSFHEGKVEIRRISKIDEETKALITLDFLLVTPALEEIWQKRKQVEWVKGIIWVVSREGLITLKTISGRKQDIADIERLEGLEDES